MKNRKIEIKKNLTWGALNRLSESDVKFINQQWSPGKSDIILPSLAVLSLPPPQPGPALEPKTQKAKGILKSIEIICDEYPNMYLFFKSIGHRLIQKENDIDINISYFARPCPTVPRHGFVDSRVVSNNDELLKLWKEVINNDPDGEIILGPKFNNVLASAVLVSSGILSVGKGNDGATAGKDSVSFPVAPTKLDKGIICSAGIKDSEAVYIESIFPKSELRDKWALTQVRGGPELNTTSPDFIPEDTVVKKIVLPNNNLLEWEKEVRDFAPGTVVFGDGYTLASHAAIHCVINKIPFITTSKPKIGSKLASLENKKNKLRRRQFKKGVNSGINICRTTERKDMQGLFYFSISVLHNWPYIKNSSHADWLLGASSIILAKLCAALALGENRHSKYNKIYNTTDRNLIYLQAINKPTQAFYKLPEALRDFYSKDWESGFGGSPWATCTWYSNQMWKQIVSIFNHKSTSISDKEIRNLVGIINKTVNLAHNGGWWFDKFTDKENMDFICNYPGLAAFCVSDIFLNLYNRVASSKEVSRALKKTQIINPPCGKDENNNLVWIKINGVLSEYTSVTIRRENGGSELVKINLTKSEMKAIRSKYRKHNKCYSESIAIQVRNKMFRLPGGKPKPINKVFAS